MSNENLFGLEKNQDILEINNEIVKQVRKKRFKGYSPLDNILINLEPDKMFPFGTYERFIIDTMNELKLEKFEYTHKNDLGGSEEYNPKSILGVLFYGYTNGIFNSRKLEKLCKNDVRYMFISGHTTPEHSTISRFLIRYSKEISELFAQVLYIAIKSDYVNYKMIVTDGTKLRANAGEKFCGTIEDFKKRKNKLEKKISEAVKRQKETDKKEELEYWQNKEKRHEKEKEKITNFLTEAREIYTKDNKEQQQNITDKDCRIVKESGGGFIQGYNGQISACEKNGIIVATSISNSATDKEQFKVMVEKAQEAAPEDKKASVKKGKWISDNGYYSTDNIMFCHNENIDAYISDKQDKEIFLSEENNEQELTLNNSCKIIGEHIYCWSNKKLKFKKVRISEGDKYNIYQVEEKKGCENCEKYSVCIGKNKNKEFWVKEKILKNITIITKIKNKLRTKEGKMIYSRRMPTIEKVFGYFKGILNFKQFSLRGLEKVKVLWTLLCSMYNLRRIYTLKYSK